jgi:hypothetical protein
MKKVIFGTIIALGFILLLSQMTEAQSTKHISGDNWFGCSSKKEFSKITDYAVEGDEQAFRSALAEGILSGSVTLFDNGELVFIVDTAVFSGLIKVHKNGETREYWTNLEAVK